MEDLLSNVKEQHVSLSDFLRDGRHLILEIKICKNPPKNMFRSFKMFKSDINQISGSEDSFIIFSLRCLQADRRLCNLFDPHFSAKLL